jgi:hypothetical protein
LPNTRVHRLSDSISSGQDRGDAAAGRERHVVPPRRRVQPGAEPAGRGHQFQLVADLQPLGGILGEHPTGDPFHRDAQRAAGGR